MKKILVIDDDARLLNTITSALTAAGYEAMPADSGELGLVFAQAVPPDLVVCDVNLGGMDGFKVLQDLRAGANTSAIPIILMTGGETVHRQGMESGADDFLAKPFAMGDLLAAVRARLERQDRLHAQARENEERFLEILAATHDFVAIAEAESGQLLYLNPAGRTMLGLGPEEEPAPLRLVDFFADHPTALPVAEAGEWMGESEFVSRHGQRIPVSLQILAHRATEDRSAYLSITARDLTERLAAEQALRESENLYRNLIQCQGEGFVIIEPDLQFAFANPAAETVFAVAPGQLVGRNVNDFLNAAGRAAIAEQLQVQRVENRAGFELELRLAGGERRQILVTVTPKFDGAGQFCGTYAVFRDITLRKTAEEALAQQLQLAALGAEIGIALTRQDSLAGILQKCTEVMVQRLDVAFARIWTLNANEDVLELKASAGLYTHLNGPHSRVPVGKYKIGLIAQERRPHLTNHVIGDPRVGDQEWARREGMLAFAGYPLVVAGQVVGVMAMFARHELSAAIFQELSAVADTVALGIVRQQIEEKLRLQTSALEAAANGVVISDRNGRILWVNPAFTRLTGYSAADAIGKTPAVLKSGIHDKAFYAHLWQTVSSGRVWQGELFNRRKDGSLYCEDMTITPVPGSDGQVQNFVAIKQDITGRKQAEEALRAQEQRTHSIIEQAFDAIVTADGQGKIIEWNRQAERTFGWTREEVLHRELTETIIPPGQRGEPADSLRQVFATGTGPALNRRMELTTRHKDGHEVPVELAITAVQSAGGYILNAFLRDITEHKREEAERRAIESRYQTLFDSAADAIMTLDGGGFLDCNSAALRMFGYADKSDFVALHPGQLSPPRQPDGQDSRSAADQRIAVAFERGVNRFEWVHRRREGEDFPAEVVLAAFRMADRPVLQATVRDLTHLKAAEKARQQMELQLRQAHKLEAIGQLAAGIAHEINTPTQYVGDNTRFLKDSFGQLFTVLKAYRHLLDAVKLNRLTPEEVARVESTLAASDMEYLFEQIPAAISETLEGVARVTKIVRAMKEFSHPGGKEKAASDLNKALETTVTVARNEWKYVADLELDLAPDLPPVPCFLGEFNQCILNLVVNAAHAIAEVVKQQPGTKGRIVIRSRREGDHVEVRVSDTGTGIAEALRPRIFEPFFTTKEVGKGTGQGLSMIYATIVRQHGGDVRFETETGHGTTFILRLPLVARMAIGPNPAPVTSAPAPVFTPVI